jgi:hypothetical protein
VYRRAGTRKLPGSEDTIMETWGQRSLKVGMIFWAEETAHTESKREKIQALHRTVRSLIWMTCRVADKLGR